jgi:hypothetical protein
MNHESTLFSAFFTKCRYHSGDSSVPMEVRSRTAVRFLSLHTPIHPFVENNNIQQRKSSNRNGDPYCVTLRPCTGKSHLLKTYTLMVHAQKSQLRNFRRLARSHGYSISTSLFRSLQLKISPTSPPTVFLNILALRITSSDGVIEWPAD